MGEEEGSGGFISLQPLTSSLANGSMRQRRHTLYQRPTLATSLHQSIASLAAAYPLPIARRTVTLGIVQKLMDPGLVYLVGLPLQSQKASVRALGEEGGLPIYTNQSQSESLGGTKDDDPLLLPFLPCEGNPILSSRACSLQEMLQTQPSVCLEEVVGCGS